MTMDDKTTAFYARLKDELANSTLWPSEYLYKFIVPSDANKVLEVQKAFDNMGAVIKTNTSKTGKFTSLSINVRMKSPQHVIDKYIEVSHIEGIVSL